MAREIVDRDGALTLARSGAVWEILWEGTFLMSSECRAGERALGALGFRRTLVGGLGLGFTVRAALDAGATGVDVVELSAAVVRWNRSLVADCAARPLDDARVRVHLGDVGAFVRAAPPGSYDRVLYDVDNGPSWTARPENAALYGGAALDEVARALAPGGRFAVWSAQAEPAFLLRLRARFDDVREEIVPVEVAGRASNDFLYVASQR